MRTYLKKFTIALLVFVMLFNFCGGAMPKAQANIIDDIMGGLVGLLTWPSSLRAVLIGTAIQFIGAKVAYAGRHD